MFNITKGCFSQHLILFSEKPWFHSGSQSVSPLSSSLFIVLLFKPPISPPSFSHPSAFLSFCFPFFPFFPVIFPAFSHLSVSHIPLWGFAPDIKCLYMQLFIYLFLICMRAGAAIVCVCMCVGWIREVRVRGWCSYGFAINEFTYGNGECLAGRMLLPDGNKSDLWQMDWSQKQRKKDGGRERETDLRENRTIPHLISQTLIYRRFHKRERGGKEIKLLHALIISYILY